MPKLHLINYLLVSSLVLTSFTVSTTSVFGASSKEEEIEDNATTILDESDLSEMQSADESYKEMTDSANTTNSTESSVAEVTEVNSTRENDNTDNASTVETNIKATQTVKALFPNDQVRHMVVGGLQTYWNAHTTEDSLVDQDILNLIKAVNFDSTMGVIESLDGIEKLTNLEEISIQGNAQNFMPLSDLSPLSSLSNLQVIRIQYASIVDLSPISQLINLTEINFNENKIVDTTPLAGLTKLRSVTLERNRTMSNFSGLSSLVNLESLYMFNTGFSDLSVLSGLLNLRYMDVERCRITDEGLKGLTNVPKLSTIRANDNLITSVDAFANFPNLTSLEINFNQVSDLTPLNGLGISVKANSQEVTGESVVIPKGTGAVELPVKHLDGKALNVSTISNSGTYDSSANMLEFNIDNLNLSGGSITFSWSGSNFSGTYTMPYTVEEGTLKLEVPSKVDFGSLKLGSDNLGLSWPTSSTIIVTDDRVNSTGWVLTAQLENTSSDFANYLMNNSERLSDNSIVAQSNTGGTIEVDESWSGKKGIWIDYSSITQVRKDSGKIVWTLSPSTKEVAE